MSLRNNEKSKLDRPKTCSIQAEGRSILVKTGVCERISVN